MSRRSSGIQFLVAGVLILGAGCTAVPEGYTRQQWKAMSPEARRPVLRREAAAGDQLHRDLARDAATENGFIR